MRETAVLYIVDGRKTDISNAAAKKYKVQYNPTEITVNAGEPLNKSGKTKLLKTGTDREHKVAEYGAEQYAIRVTIPLTFDNSKEYTEGLKGKIPADESAYSVRTEVEGFIAMLRNPNIRYLTFSWGAMCYSGELVSLSGQYTMFTESGTPVRAVLSLTVKCRDFDNNNQWLGMYSQAFSTDINKKIKKSSKGSLNKALLKISKVKHNAATGAKISDKSSVYTMEVEYNPASISVSAGISLSEANALTEDGRKKAEKKPSAEISFQLIFDSTGSGETDVACVTNGLAALMTDKAMTEMEFCWGDMSFKGHLSGIQAKFTMFSEAGIPKRSAVDISLGREDGGDTYWDSAFDRLVEKKYGSL